MDSNNNGANNENNRTDSNLPILFANGYPTSLENMKKESLELFIPFLVQCSEEGLTDENLKAPKWWPNDVHFKFPIEKPKRYKKEWEQKLRDIVRSCYLSSNSEYLLQYSEKLSQIPTESLHYKTVSDLTTSLFRKEDGIKKLLITFRNENMLYDKKKRMQLWQKSELSIASQSPDPDEATFQIMLCDFCDSEFYSDEALEIHEAKCRDTNQEMEEAEEGPIIENIVISDDDDEIDNNELNQNNQDNFLSYFALGNLSSSNDFHRKIHRSIEKSSSPKKRRPTTRKVVNKKQIENEKLIPFSSPLGLVLNAKKKRVDQNYFYQRYEDFNAYCGAKPSTNIQNRSKIVRYNSDNNSVFKDMRKPRHYYWPKRQLKSRCKKVNFEFLNRSLIQQMQPMKVECHMLQKCDIDEIQAELQRKREEKKRLEMESCIAVEDSEDDEDDTSTKNHANSTLFFDNIIQKGFSSNEVSIFHSSRQSLPGMPSTSSSLTIRSTFKRSLDSGSNSSDEIKQWLQNINTNPTNCV